MHREIVEEVIRDESDNENSVLQDIRSRCQCCDNADQDARCDGIAPEEQDHLGFPLLVLMSMDVTTDENGCHETHRESNERKWMSMMDGCVGVVEQLREYAHGCRADDG